MDAIIEHEGLISALFTGLTGLGISLSLIFNYNKSDGLKRILIGKSMERFLSSLLGVLGKVFFSIFLTSLIWLSYIKEHNYTLAKFTHILFSDGKEYKAFLAYSVFFVLGFTFFISQIFRSALVFNSKNKTSKSSYYINSEDLKEKVDAYNHKVFIVDALNDKEVLCIYFSNTHKSYVRVIIPHESIIGISIYFEKKKSFFSSLREFNIDFQNSTFKQKVSYLLIFFIPFAINGIIIYKIEGLASIVGFLFFYLFAIGLCFIPTILFYLRAIRSKKSNKDKTHE